MPSIASPTACGSPETKSALPVKKQWVRGILVTKANSLKTTQRSILPSSTVGDNVGASPVVVGAVNIIMHERMRLTTGVKKWLHNNPDLLAVGMKLGGSVSAVR